MKLRMIIDSSAGIDKKEADKRGWDFLPLYMTIDNKDYADGIDLDTKNYYKLATLDSEVRTSATPPGIAMDIIEKASKENDYVLIYALSTGLSSQTNNIKMLTSDLDNVFVVPSLGVGYAITRDVEELEKLAKAGKSWEEIKKAAVEMTNDLYGIVAPETMKWLVKGGRVSPAAAGMANLLKIVPLISFTNGGLDKYGKGRVFKKSISKFAKDLKDKYGDDREYIIYNAGNSDIKEITKMIKEIIGDNVILSDFPSVIVNHTGPGAIGIITRKKG